MKIARAWEWNGDVVNPTVSPSVKHFVPESADVEPELKKFVCHYFIKNGAIEFCGDCTHGKAGQVLPLESYSEAEVKLHSLEQ